ncbi:uncharacterized protein B0P05DRAFT_530043 [Gilbertella persicaria]|uniref:Uncharacterized protein n=1 Tax=Rhizopus stolonifer TaxID=4846 RepID=A0A367JHX2_RHIST|nr:uncharacterized protein B0P05DRAFT_530043 [Gilbertella persicaria]KAI8090256.1 hypothetical protein B0P05DRAFT_530043 [Gilbertella persicaria]RCH89469.1 hypothetical protein CU098_000837 [Rhizopus stolonifer]
MLVHLFFFFKMNIIDKIKVNISVWRLEQKTKRRSLSPEFQSKSKQYYKDIYRDGVYDTYDLKTKKNMSIIDSLTKVPSHIGRGANAIWSFSSSNNNK